ncbi:glycylpeptide N-tetradecanoyltransferase [Nematocida sp. LUAm3]|nr:glycylpeptide N-tetradecanoyltransferase [Nematocida sp. LUAm3]KAI5173622.1 glycylpeptide N-tetradecanoyltransferase [Nematocida sp. LUAm2]KAI5176843.1 glycylpeptide N-tetradecanoyltransferase [Nematocida sp. LUAm1]
MKDERKSEFWSTQPVGLEELQQEKKQFHIPEGFLLRTLQIDTELDSLYDLLKNHYVEDEEYMFRLEYSKPFLLWQLSSPYTYPEWNIGMYHEEKLIGFISAVEIHIKVNDDSPKSSVVNYLCLHRAYRSKKLAPVLISEVRKRVNERNIHYGMFTSGVRLPFAVSRVYYYHKILNGSLLVEKGFCRPSDVEEPLCDPRSEVRWRKAEEKDLAKVYDMYIRKYKELSIHAVLSMEQFKYYIFPRDGLTECLISRDEDEFISFFFLDTRVIKDSSVIKTVYLHYHYMHVYREGMNETISYLKNKTEYQILNALAVEENTPQLLNSLGFLKGDGLLSYYLFNWKSERVPENKNGFIPF